MWRRVMVLLCLGASAHAADPLAPSPALPAAPSVWTPAPIEADPFQWDIPVVAVQAGEEAKLTLRLVVPPGYHVYRDQLEVNVVSDGGLKVGAADFPPGIRRVDPAIAGAGSTEARELYEQDVFVYLPVRAGAKASGGLVLELELRHQGCRAGLCFPPSTQRKSVLVPVRSAGPG